MARSRRDRIRPRRVSYEGIRHYRRGDTTIEFTLERSQRRTIGVTVFPGGGVRVRAPQRASEEAVMALVAGRERWIVQKQRVLADFPLADERRFEQGYPVPFLGRDRRIVIGDAEARRPRVQLRRDELRVDGALSPREIHRAVYRWYRTVALRVFRHRMRTLRKRSRIALLGEPTGLTLRLMRRRWGSCFTDRRITLNPELCAAAVTEIDYVILHEICHFREHNHSARFYHLLDERMPDWKERRDRLNRTIPTGFLRAP